MFAKPDWFDADPSIDGLVASWGYGVVASKTFGSWQGDIAYIFANGDRLGIIVIGYGSCSGCDAFEAATPFGDDADWSQLESLRFEWREAVRWFDSPVEALVALDLASARGSDWWVFDKEIIEWLRHELPEVVPDGLS